MTRFLVDQRFLGGPVPVRAFGGRSRKTGPPRPFETNRYEHDVRDAFRPWPDRSVAWMQNGVGPDLLEPLDALGVVKEAHAASLALLATKKTGRAEPVNIEAGFRTLPVELQEMIFTLARAGDDAAPLKWLLLAQRFPMACRKCRAPVEMAVVTYGMGTQKIVCPARYAANFSECARPWAPKVANVFWTHETPRRDLLPVYLNGYQYTGAPKQISSFAAPEGAPQRCSVRVQFRG